jgi:glycerol kinase
MGAAYLAGLAVGYWDSLDEIRKNWAVDRCFAPQITEDDRKVRLKGWQKAVSCAAGWAKE